MGEATIGGRLLSDRNNLSFCKQVLWYVCVRGRGRGAEWGGGGGNYKGEGYSLTETIFHFVNK